MFRFPTWTPSSLCSNLGEFNLDLSMIGHISSLFHLINSPQCISVWLWITVWFLRVLLRASFGWKLCWGLPQKQWELWLLRERLEGSAPGPASSPHLLAVNRSETFKPLVSHRLSVSCVHQLLWSALKSSLHFQSLCPAGLLGTAGWHQGPRAQPSTPMPPWEGQTPLKLPRSFFLPRWEEWCPKEQKRGHFLMITEMFWAPL